MLMATLREIFEESAYERFLAKTQVKSSPAAYGDFLRWPGQPVSAALALLALHETGVSELAQNGIEEFLGNVGGVSNLGDLYRLTVAAPRQDEEGAQGIMGFLGQHVPPSYTIIPIG